MDWGGPGDARLPACPRRALLPTAKYLVDVVEAGALVRPVVVALPHAVLREGRQHDHDRAAALPHHLPTDRTAAASLPAPRRVLSRAPRHGPRGLAHEHCPLLGHASPVAGFPPLNAPRSFHAP